MISSPPSKPRVLLVADVRGWAFDNICQNLINQLSVEYSFTVVYMGDIMDRPWIFVAEHLMEEPYDIVHFFWRDDLRTILWPDHLHRAASQSGVAPALIIDALARPVITASIYDHLHLDMTGPEDRAAIFRFAHGYAVSSPRLNRIYSDLPDVPPPDCVITDGVDVALFAEPKAADARPPQPDGALVIGWVGNSRWGEHSHADAKGLRTILRPALDLLQAEGLSVVGSFADSQQQKRTRAEMVDYYKDIDVLVCASTIEGTPNPVLEAMAAGAAIVSTDVGIVPDVLGPLQHDFILQERTPEAMAAMLRRLVLDRGLLARLRAENRTGIQRWDWSERTRDWSVLWQAAALRQADVRQAQLRRSALMARVGLDDAGQRLTAAPSLSNTLHKLPVLSRMRYTAARQLYRYPRLVRIVNKMRGRS